MKPWPIFPLLLLFQQPVALGQGAADLMKKGEAALDSSLWEIAELHFRNAIADNSLNPELKTQAMVHLAEALVREGSHSEALDLLGLSTVSQHPEASFWKAQALAGQLRLNEAVAVLSAILANPASARRAEAGFTQASLQLALDQPDAALLTLSSLILDSDPATVARIKLYQVEIFIDLGRIEDARRAMPEKPSIEPLDRPLLELLEAQLQLREGHPEVAEVAFQKLLNRPLTGQIGLPFKRYHQAAVGLSDAIQAQHHQELAATTLLNFIDDHPDTPMLEAMFSRILQWLPEKPTATDPILEHIDKWIITPVLRFPPLLRPTTDFLNPVPSDTTVVSAWPVGNESVERKDLQAYSLFTQAVGLHRVATPEAQAKSRSLLNRLRIQSPDHPLASRALYQLARWHLDEGAVALALSILETLRDSKNDSQLKGQSAFLQARVSYLNGDPAKAAQLFDEAAKSLTGKDARTAKLQEAVARIRAGDSNGPSLIRLEGQPPDKELEADLELERALSATPAESARTALDGFLTKNPDHPRGAEARLAAAEAALSTPTPDLSFAGAQLDALAAAPDKAASLPPARLALARLRFSDLSNKSAATIAAAQAVVDTYPNQPEAAEAAFILGLNQFRTENYNPARLAFEKLAAIDTDLIRAQAAWLLAARSAALGGTEASRREALILFDKTIEAGGPVTGIAVLEKSRHLIDLSRPDEAADFLQAWIARQSAEDPLQLPAGLLLGEALFAQGSTRPTSLAEALAVYDGLLSKTESFPALRNRLQFLRGKTLELMPDEKDPSKTREKQAFQAYHSVLETTTPPVEWEYFESCAFRAFELLEKAHRWQAAINVAKKIASFKGPRAEEAASRASEIQLKQMLWED